MKVNNFFLIAFCLFFIQIGFSGTTATVCSSGCDYDNIQEAIDSIPSDLSSSGGGVWTVEIEAGTYNEDIDISGFSNASSSDYIVIKAKSGDEHKGDFNSGVRIIGTSSSSHVLNNATNYTQLYDLVVSTENKANGYHGVYSTGTNTEFYQIFSRVDDEKNTACFYVNVASAKIFNSIAWRSRNDTPWGTNIGFRLSSTTEVYNSVAYNHYNGFWGGVLKNCVAFNSLYDDFKVYNASSDYNVSEDGSADNTNDLNSQSVNDVKFDNIYLGDFRPIENSVLIGGGVNPSAGFSTDIIGETITDWMIGPFHSVDSNYNDHCDVTGEYHVENGVDTIQSVINSIPDTLIHCGPQVVYLEAGDYNENIEISGFVWPSESDYIEIRSESGDEHLGVFGGGVKVIGSDTNAAVINISTEYTRITNIEASTENKNTGTNYNNYSIKTTAKYVELENVLSYTDHGGSPGIDISENYTKCINCIVWNSETGSKYGTAIGIKSNSNSEVYNSLAYSFYFGFISGAIKNSVCYKGSGNTCFSSYQSASDHNVSSDATANDTANGDIPNLNLDSLKFTNNDSGLFKPLAGSVLIKSGTDVSAEFQYDIELISISYWSIGPFSEYTFAPDVNFGDAYAYWKFDEGLGDTAFDESENNVDGSLINMDSTNWTDGYSGSGILFSEGNDYISIGSPWADVKGNFSVSFWAIPSATHVGCTESNSSPIETYEMGGQRFVMSPLSVTDYQPPCCEGHQIDGISLGTNGISIYEQEIWYGGRYWCALNYNTTISDSNWTFFTITINSGEEDLYINGVWKADGINWPNLPRRHPGKHLGGPSSLSWSYLGKLDELIVFNKTLDSSEVAYMYNTYITSPLPKLPKEFDKENLTDKTREIFFKIGNNLVIKNTIGEIEIFSILGKKVTSVKVSGELTLDLNGWPEGVYLLKFQNKSFMFKK